MAIARASTMVDLRVEVAEGNREIVASYSKATDAARSIAASLMETVTADSCAPASESSNVSQKEGNSTTAISPAQAGSSFGQGETKIEAGRKELEIFIVNEDKEAG